MIIAIGVKFVVIASIKCGKEPLIVALVIFGCFALVILGVSLQC